MATIEKNGKVFVVQQGKLTDEELVAKLRLFHHYQAADRMEELLEIAWKYESLQE